MSNYFAVGNLWLLVAGIVFWGRGPGNSADGSLWQLFHVGRNFEAYQYAWCLGVPIALAAICFVLQWRWSRSAMRRPIESGANRH